MPLLPYLLSFAAGAMIDVVVEELIPEAQSGKHSNIATIGVAVGVVLLMILDVAVGGNIFFFFGDLCAGGVSAQQKKPGKKKR